MERTTNTPGKRAARTVWTSLLHVESLRPQAEFIQGFVNAVTLAPTREQAVAGFERAVLSQGFRLVSAEETEPLDDRRRRGAVHPDLVRLGRLAKEAGEVHFGSLYTWDEEGDEVEVSSEG
jgi:hypothetical protein